MSDVGAQLRQWRRRRRLSQLDLALEAAVSTRHLSCIETGRARPSRAMVLHLAERLDVPLRERNALLLAAGYAPAFGERRLEAPELGAVREVLERVLAGHEPYPALVVDGDWNLVAANESAYWLARDVAPRLLEPPVNVLRMTLHPDGLAPAIVNLGELRAHVLANLGRQVARDASPALAALYEELAGYPGDADEAPAALAAEPADGILVPLRVRTDDGRELSLISTIASFARAVDATVAELAIESFYPADAATAALLAARRAVTAGA